jgi:sulfhydrogenase subunit beta (sulfur reductase)
MSLRILPKEQVPRMVEALMADYRVMGPRAKGPQFGFERIADPAELQLGYNISILPPKTALQPPEERIATFAWNGEPSVQSVIEAEPTVLLGVHTCDLRALQLLDQAFSADYPDAHYLERRQQTLIVSLECLQPCDEHSFCKSMGTWAADDGYDLHLTDVGEAYTVHVGTEAGKALLEKVDLSHPAADGDVRRLNEVLGAKWPRFPHRLSFDVAELPALLERAYDHPVWAELGERCLSCGSCTNVCPTCYCFNVLDSIELSQTAAIRTRRWDSCQLDEFARVAGGENFREARAARQRHRMLRKGKYLWERFGVLGCVGCGRCIRACLVHINIVDTFNAVHNATIEVT